MRRPGGEILAYGTVLIVGGAYLFARLPHAQPRFQVITGVVAVSLLIIGTSLLSRYRWSPELTVVVMAFMLGWALVAMAMEGFTRGRLILAFAAVAALFGYPSLRRQVRDSTIHEETGAAKRFKPPGLERLAEVDTADCEYHSSCVDIRGVVSPSGQCGWSGTADYEVHCFSFSAWRRIDQLDQRVNHRTLTILRPVAPDDDWTSTFPKYAIRRINVLLSKDETRAVFASDPELNDDHDDELIAVARELQKPVVVLTPQFGDLTLNREIGRFEGKTEWNGEQIRLTIDTVDKSDITAAIKDAETLWDAQGEWKRKVEEFAVRELLPLKNEIWLGDDEKPLTAEQFKSSMTLQSISISLDGSFEFWHDDGDLFWGHSIQISGSLKHGLTNADIPG